MHERGYIGTYMVRMYGEQIIRTKTKQSDYVPTINFLSGPTYL